MSADPQLRIETIQVSRLSRQGQLMEAYIAEPSESGPFPGILVIHEIYGLNDNIRDITRRFAGQGYAALAVDLFSGASRISCMLQIIYGMMFRPLDNGPLVDLKACLAALGNRPGVDSGRLGVVGFCMGGSYALQLACVGADLKGASVFYGQNPRPLEAVARACPINASYPEKDFTARAGQALEQALQRYDVPHDIKIYPGARHSFFNDQGPAFDPTAAADAWERMLAFFGEHLQAAR